MTIDGRSVRVPKGTLVLDAATELGIHIPIYCAHAKMEPVAAGRACIGTMASTPKPQPACATVASDGMVVVTQVARHGEFSRLADNLIPFNHPLDCPVCDRG